MTLRSCSGAGGDGFHIPSGGRVADLFEARNPKEAAILAEKSGVVSFGKETKGKVRLVITPDDGGKDLFVHYSNIDGDGFKSLSEGQKVSFEPGEGRKGPEATSVQPQ